MTSTLPREIITLIRSPYQISLRSLSVSLENVEDRVVRDYLATNPCVVDPLARSLIDALKYCPYALQCTERLARTPLLRDALLAVKPALLDFLLQSALKDENKKYFLKYSPICVALLSSPLPAKFPTPAPVTPFFLRMVEYATRQPEANSLRGIYTLVNSGFAFLESTMNDRQRQALQESLNGMIKDEDQTVLMYAVGSLAKLYIERSKNGVRDSAASFFEGNKSKALLGLICKNVVAAVADEEGGMEIIRVAAEIVKAVKEERRAAFLKEREADRTLSSLWGKLGKGAASEEMWEAVIRFALALGFPGKGMKGLIDLVFEKVERGIKEEANGKGDLFLAPGCAEILLASDKPELLTDIVKSALELSTATPQYVDASYGMRLSNRRQFIDELAGKLEKCSPLLSPLLSTLSTNELHQPIKRYLSLQHQTTTPHACASSAVSPCAATVLNNQYLLHLSLRTLILRSALLSPTSLADPTLPLTLLTLPSPPHIPCTVPPSPPPAHHSQLLDLLESPSTQQPGASQEWRARLLDELSLSATRTHQKVVSFLGEITRDLETRCEGIEAPLRDAQALAEGYREKYEAEKRAGEGLREEVGEVRAELERALHAEEVLRERLEDLEERVQEAGVRERGLEEELRRVKGELEVEAGRAVKAQEEGTVLRDGIKTLEGEREELRSAVERLDGEGEALNNRIEGLQNEKEGLAREIEVLQSEKEEATKTIEGLKAEKERLKKELEEATAEGMEAKATINELRKRNEELGDELASKLGEISDKDRQLEDMSMQLANAQKENGALKATVEERIQEVIVLNADAEETAERNAAELEKLRLALSLAESKAEDLGLIKTRLESDLEAQIDKYNHHVSETEKTLSDQSTAIANLTQARDALTSDLEQVRSEMRSAQESSAARLTALQSHADALTSQNAVLTTTISTLESSKQSLAAEAGDLRKRVGALQSHLSSAKTDLQALSGKHADLARKYKEKSRQLGQITKLLGATTSAGADSSPVGSPVPLRDVSREFSNSQETREEEGVAEERDAHTPKRARTRKEQAPPPPPTTVRRSTRRPNTAWRDNPVPATSSPGLVPPSRQARPTSSTPSTPVSTVGRGRKRTSVEFEEHSDWEGDDYGSVAESFLEELRGSTPKGLEGDTTC